MNDAPKCSQCGAALAADAPEGLCPRCLMALNLASQTALPEEAGPNGTRVVSPSALPPPTPAEMAPHFPQLEILECLGCGGMGVVYKARQPLLNRIVALKILTRDREKDGPFAERFMREAQALARLNHPSIVTVYDFGESNGLYYLLMEYVDGLNLRQLLQSGKLQPAEALAIVPQICDALQFAHNQGIVHRDIKPENILLDKQGRVKIADFGLAKLLGLPAPAQRLTEANQVMGTPHYMAPEQTEHPQTVDHRADIYSLGVVFYEMLTGELPLGRFAAPSEKVQVDVRLDEVVLKALAKEPQRRYQQASAVKTDVETIANTPAEAAPPVIEPPVPRSTRPASSRPLAYLALGLFLAGLLVTLLLLAIVPVRDEMALLFGVTAEVLALAFGLITWRERLGKFVAIATLVVFVMAGGALLFLAAHGHGWNRRVAAQAEAERARQAEAKALFQTERATVPTQVAKVYTQEQICDVQPDGMIKFRSTLTQQNNSSTPLRTIQFMNSDFVEVTQMFDALGRDLPFEVTHQGRRYQYRATLPESVPPGAWMTYSSEGTMKGLIRSVPNTRVFEYRMQHSPGFDGVTRRIERYRLPPGAAVLDAQPADLQRRERDGRVELAIDRQIPKGGSLAVMFRYQLDDASAAGTADTAEDVVRQAVEIVSTCAEGDPRIKEALRRLQALDADAAVQALTTRLDATEPTQRRAAIYLLQNGGWKDLTAAAPKLLALLAHEEVFTRGMAALALGQGKVTASFDSIAQMATNDASGYARRCAAYALGLLGDARAEAVLKQALEDKDPLVKANAAVALERLREPAVPAPALEESPAPPSGASVPSRLLNEEQRLVEAWTDRQFRSFFDRRDFAAWKPDERAELEARMLDALKGPRSRDYYQAICTLGALRSTNALPPLLAIAADRAEKDNRDRWMAIRALGLIGDRAVVPELVPLVYHGNVNSRWWAQLSLARLTGTNFGGDWRAWAEWWNRQAGQSPVPTNEMVIWYKDPAFSDPERLQTTLRESDQKFLESVRQSVPAAQPAPAKP